VSKSNPSDPGKASSRRFPAPDRGVGPTTSLARCAVAILLVVAGVAWMAVYLNVAEDGGRLGWMSDLGRWSYVIGFLSIFAGLAVSAHPSTPLGRGRGVVVGMLGCFIIGLVWICVYYIAGREAIPVVQDLQNYNLVVGIGFMAVGFVFATRWE
jgi:hypothetical protein